MPFKTIFTVLKKEKVPRFLGESPPNFWTGGDAFPLPSPPCFRCPRQWRMKGGAWAPAVPVCQNRWGGWSLGLRHKLCLWRRNQTLTKNTKFMCSVAEFRKLGGKVSLTEKICTSSKNRNYIHQMAISPSSLWPSNDSISVKGILAKKKILSSFLLECSQQSLVQHQDDFR